MVAVRPTGSEATSAHTLTVGVAGAVARALRVCGARRRWWRLEKAPWDGLWVGVWGRVPAATSRFTYLLVDARVAAVRTVAAAEKHRTQGKQRDKNVTQRWQTGFTRELADKHRCTPSNHTLNRIYYAKCGDITGKSTWKGTKHQENAKLTQDCTGPSSEPRSPCCTVGKQSAGMRRTT